MQCVNQSGIYVSTSSDKTWSRKDFGLVKVFELVNVLCIASGQNFGIRNVCTQSVSELLVVVKNSLG